LKITIYFLLVFTSLFAQEKVELFFDFNQNQLNFNSENVLKQWIKENSTSEIYKLEGYCDTVDSKNYNLKLAERRISSVENYLKENQIKISDSVRKITFGEDFDFSSNQAENRKVVFYFEDLKHKKNEVETEIVEIKKNESLQDIIENERITLLEKFEKAKVGDIITIENIHYYFNTDIIIPDSYPLMEQLLLAMELSPYLEIKILGHICCNPDINDTKLSFKRALKILNYLNENGIGSKRLSHIGLGSSKPVFKIPEKSEEEQAANRRVEIKILKN
jgi:outer membrane protein OmpA-like peptidoglycan-associated protein